MTFTRALLIRAFQTLSFSSILFASAGALQADVVITSGTVNSAGGQFPTGSISIAGPNLSVTGLTYTGYLSLLTAVGHFESVTLYPAQNVNLASNLGPTLTYNGQIYPLFTLQMNFTAAPVSAPNTFAAPSASGNYKGDVTNVAFAMTGTISIFSDRIGGTVAQSIPISGTGIYIAEAYGNFEAGGPGGVPQGQVTYQFASPAGFLPDTTTQGAWINHYGGDGYAIANGASPLPPYAAVNFSRASTYTWAGQTSDVRALEIGPSTTNRIASAYTGSNFDIRINMADGNLHRVALYLLDWDSTTRAETITIRDAATNALIDTEAFSNFSAGEYAAWNLKGNVVINVASTGVGQAAISGIFFGPSGSAPLMPTGPTASAIFSGVSPYPIKGVWYNAFGQNGYLIANGPSKPPSYAVASVNGDFTYTWAAQTSDVRALSLAPDSAVGIASAYTQYPGAPFNIHINVTDGVNHLVTLYLLDWDSTSRSETITIRDASTNALLTTETFSGFNSGQYATWSITGNVIITVSPNNNTAPVVSGIFFN